VTPADCREASRDDHAAACLLTNLFGRDLIDVQPVTPEVHQAFRESISAPARPFDAVDLALDEDEDDFDPCLLDRPPGRRSEAETSRLDAIFAELDRRDG
jgi:hypothetical protein